MKLITIPASPYGRKVRIVLHEAGLQDQVDIVMDNPWKDGSKVTEWNPVGKVPVLITNETGPLFDSAVICEYLDNLAGAGLYPAPGPDRWAALRRQRLADQLLDAFVLARLEGNRPTERQHPPWIERQRAVQARCLDAMEAEARALGQTPDIGHCAFAAALGHLDFRRGSGTDWREGRPRLAEWYARFAQRPSMTQTLPQD